MSDTSPLPMDVSTTISSVGVVRHRSVVVTTMMTRSCPSVITDRGTRIIYARATTPSVSSAPDGYHWQRWPLSTFKVCCSPKRSSKGKHYFHGFQPNNVRPEAVQDREGSSWYPAQGALSFKLIRFQPWLGYVHTKRVHALDNKKHVYHNIRIQSSQACV